RFVVKSELFPLALICGFLQFAQVNARTKHRECASLMTLQELLKRVTFPLSIRLFFEPTYIVKERVRVAIDLHRPMTRLTGELN
ncbi:MAG: hypothetical protein ABSA96_16180, partial [Candidatus Acidiferrales bacterium]